MSSKPVASIVIPVWNTGKVACELLEVLIAQPYRKIEIIVVDDGSTDDSLALLKDFAKKDQRIRIMHQENGGVSVARNTGIAEARGKYLMFIDSDDLIEPEYIRVMVNAMEGNSGIDMAVAGKIYNKLNRRQKKAVFVSPRRARREHEALSDYMTWLMIRDGRMYSVTNKIFRTRTIQEQNLEFEVGRDFAEDTKFVIDYLKTMRGEILFILEPLAIYNYGTTTSIVRNGAKKWENWKKSANDLEEWMREDNHGRITVKSWALLQLVKLRWRISWYKAQRR